MATGKTWNDLKKERYKSDPARLEKIEKQVEQDVIELNLTSLREMFGKTQTEIAELVKMSQGEISRAERRDDHLVSTLRKIVEGLGGELEITARIEGKSVRLVGV